jgi:hypothetical protein
MSIQSITIPRVAPFDATVAEANTAGQSGTAGISVAPSHRDHKHATATTYTAYAAPSFQLGTSNVSGSGDSVHSGATLLVFDTTAPTDGMAVALTGAAVGSATVTARRDHQHSNLQAFAMSRLYGH